LSIFGKLFRANSIFIKIQQQQQSALHMQTNTHFLSHLARFLLE